MAAIREEIELRPQPGPQENFLSTPADIAIYGGSAGGGKSWALLLEPLRHVNVKGFGGVIFRRTTGQVLNEGGLWDEAGKIYPLVGAVPRQTRLEYVFPLGTKVRFAHMEYEKNRLDWQGAQIPFIGFDELVHFTRDQFFYMLSRNRSLCSVWPYIRATTNPDPDSWVAEFIAWWIDQETGYAIPERGGVIRWFIRVNDTIIWADSKAALVEEYGREVLPKSVTFIPASIYDNPKLLETDPGYLANLDALPTVDRERLKHGNWKIRPTAGLYFKREYFEIVEAPPAHAVRVRYWDRAATEKTQDNDPDWTVGLKLSKDRNGIYYVEDIRRFQAGPHKVEEKIANTAGQDGKKTEIGLEQEPGASGKFEANYYVRQLAGYIVKVYPATQDKVTRAKPASSQAEAGNIKLVRGDWNKAFLEELENFDGDPKKKDDQVDALSGAFAHLAYRTLSSSIASGGRRQFS
jgi:predicted phage terminase large subunit-like protein